MNDFLKHLSLRAKLLGLVTLLWVVIAVFVGLYFPRRIEILSRHLTEERLNSTASVIAAAVASPLESGAGSEIGAILQSLSTTQDMTYAAVWRLDGSLAGAYHADHLRGVMPNASTVPSL